MSKAPSHKSAPSINGNLPNGWRMVRFDEIAQNVNDRVDPGNTDLEVYVGLEHLDPESLKIRRWGTPDDVIGQKLRFQAGDIIFGKRRAYQRKLAVAECAGICSAHAMVLRAKSEIVDPEFLPFFMQSDMFMERAIDISVGSLSPTINWKTLRIQEFPLPPKDEQRRTAETLLAANEAVDTQVSLYESLRLAAISIREHSLEMQGIEPRPLAKFLSEIVAGKSVVGVNESTRHFDYGVLKVSAVGVEGFQSSENKRILNQGDFLPEYQVRQGDLLITRCNTPELVGRVCIVDQNYPTLMLCDKTLRIDPNEEVVSKLVLLEALRTYRVRRKIMGYASGTGGAMKNISQRDVRTIPVAIPNLARQQQLHDTFSRCQSVLCSARSHLERLQNARRLLREHLIGSSSS